MPARHREPGPAGVRRLSRADNYAADRATLADAGSARRVNAECMASARPVARDRIRRARSRFGQIVCAVNGSRARRRPCTKPRCSSGPRDTLTFLAVTDARERPPRRGRQAVEAASAAAHADGVEATTVIVHAHDVATAILDAARHAGLLVLGAHGRSRIAGIMLGSSPAPVLVGPRPVRSSASREWCWSALGASRTDTPPWSRRRSPPATARASSSRTGATRTPHPPARARRAGGRRARDHRQGSRGRQRRRATGRPAAGHGGSIGAGLVVLGSRGRRDPARSPSVSERVAHARPCSVLVLAPRLAENYGRVAG